MKVSLTAWTVIGLTAVEALAVPDADPEADPGHRVGVHWFCGIPGSGCKHRSIEPEPKPLAARQVTVNGGFCGVPGEVCTTLQHSARAVRDALADHWANYDAPKTGASALCNAPGGKCAVAREAIDDVSETAENAYHELIARKARIKRPTIFIGGGTTWFCGVPGMSCKRKRSTLAINKRSDEVATAAAKALNDVDPEFLATECVKNGNECHSLLSAHAAFHQAKREVEGVQNLGDLKAKQAYCAFYGCGQDTEEYFRQLEAGSSEVKQVEAACFAEHGECTLAQRSLDVLERSLNEAIVKIA